MLLSNLYGTLGVLDRHAEAGATVRQALDLAERAGTPRLAAICNAAGAYYIEVGQWDDALAVLETAAGVLSEDVADPVTLHGQVALIAGHRDDWDTVEEHLVAVPDQVLDFAQQRLAAWCLLLARALAAEQAGRPGEAVAVLAPGLGPGVAAGMPHRDMLLPTLTPHRCSPPPPTTSPPAGPLSTRRPWRTPPCCWPPAATWPPPAGRSARLSGCTTAWGRSGTSAAAPPGCTAMASASAGAASGPGPPAGGRR